MGYSLLGQAILHAILNLINYAKDRTLNKP